jgi:hypothetical protein
VAYSWHGSHTFEHDGGCGPPCRGEARARGAADAARIDEAVKAVLARHRAVELDASCAAYDAHPLDEPDEWGDLASFREAAAAS